MLKKITKTKILSLAVIAFLFSGILFLMKDYLFNNLFPWGSDSMGHLLKIERFYKVLTGQGKILLWFQDWYLGHDLWRYYPPLGYVIGVLFTLSFTNSVLAYKILIFSSLFIASIIVFRGVRKWFSPFISACVSMLYIIFPYNIRTVFDEGNLPRTVALVFFPIFFFLSLKLIKEKKVTFLTIFLTGISFSLLLLSHPMQALMGALAIFILCLNFMVWDYSAIRYSWFIRIILAVLFGFLLAVWWFGPAYLFPEIPGFSTALSDEKLGLFSPSFGMFNPSEHFISLENIYIGISYVLFAFFAVIINFKKNSITRSLGSTAIILLVLSLGTNTALFSLIPFYRSFLAERFLNILGFFLALLIGFFLKSINDFKKTRVLAVGLVLVTIFFDIYPYFNLIRVSDYQEISGLSQKLGKIEENYRLLNLVTGPSSDEYFPITEGKKDSALGWAYESSYQGSEISQLFEAMKAKNFGFIESRLVLWNIGIIRVSEKEIEFVDFLKKHGFEENEDGINNEVLLKRINPIPYVSEIDSDILVVGKNTGAVVQLFPNALSGGSAYLEDYDIDFIGNFKTIILSHVLYKDENKLKQKLEAFLNLPDRNCLITYTTFEKFIDQEPPSFLKFQVLPIKIPASEEITLSSLKNGDSIAFTHMEEEWNSVVFTDLDDDLVITNFEGHQQSVIGKKLYSGKPLYYIGFNLFYDAFKSEEDATRKVLLDNLPLNIERISQNPVRVLDDIPFEYGVNSMRFSYSFGQSKKLMISSTYSPSFKAFVDGKEIPVHNIARLMTVEVHEGRHEVELSYYPTNVQVISFGISLFVFCGSLFFICIRKFFHRRR